MTQMKSSFHQIFILDQSATLKLKFNHRCNTPNQLKPINTETNHNQSIWTFRTLLPEYSHQNTEQNLELYINNLNQLQLQT